MFQYASECAVKAVRYWIITLYKTGLLINLCKRYLEWLLKLTWKKKEYESVKKHGDYVCEKNYLYEYFYISNVINWITLKKQL